MSRRATSSLPHRRRLAAGRSTTVSVLDVGSSKICCIIAKLSPKAAGSELAARSHSVEVLGFGHHRSRGIKSGAVVDMDAAEDSIRRAIDSAERSAGMTVDSLIVSLSAGRLSSDTFASSVTLHNRAVDDGDIRAALAAGYDHCRREGRLTLHAMPIGYSLDGEHGVEDPVGMAGGELGVDMHAVSADIGPVDNLETCINRSHLGVEALVASPYASGLATLVADEARMGCACIDMGGGTTTVSIFLGGKLVHIDAIAVGGNHVTMDLARVLSTPADDAERMKVLHGTAVPAHAGETDMVSVVPIGGDHETMLAQVSAAQLAQIIRPRIEETFELVRDRVGRSGFAGAIGNRVVLTGGASQLTGVGEVAGKVLGANVRHGRPIGIAGLPQTAKGPAFATAAGLLIYPQQADADHTAATVRSNSFFFTAGEGALARVGRWLRQTF